jgi:hypothetical protein
LDIKANTGVDLSTNADLMEIIKKTKVIEFTDGMLLYKVNTENVLNAEHDSQRMT